jgi:hypothetical protein
LTVTTHPIVDNDEDSGETAQAILAFAMKRAQKPGVSEVTLAIRAAP